MIRISIPTHRINGREAIKHDAFGVCNLRYHRPYLLLVYPTGETERQEIVRADGCVYCITEKLEIGDTFQVAGGNQRRKKPFRGRLIARDEDTLVVQELT